MAVFRSVSTQYDFPALEQRVLAFWKEREIFAKSLAPRGDADRGTFVFYEGPPTANGLPHNGHVLTRVIKDLFPRYKTMQGFTVPRKAGWDTHGLPVEVEVEKELGIHGGEAIAEYGIEPFTQRCIESVFRYTAEWERLTERIGFWVDLQDAYVTFHTRYVESVWWALSRLFAKGLLYQGHKVVWWWPQGGTALSAGEVGQGYKTVTDPAVVVRFPVDGDDGLSLLAWTTTPWTLASNVALAIGEALDYVEVEVTEGDEAGRYLLADGRREAILGDRPHHVVRTVKGSELIGLRYRPPFSFAEPDGGDPFRVIPADFVTLDQGTGVVHVAPAFGEDDYRVGREQGVGFLQLVSPDGKMTEACGEFAGRFCKEVDRDLIRDLKRRGLLFSDGQVRHEYPFCWRADDDPLIQYARKSWFVRTTEKIDGVIANNRATKWYPGHIQEGRFGDFLANNVDWALSRERFWGTPLNIWINDETGAMDAPASVDEILARNPDAFAAFDAAREKDPSLSEHLRVHKPWVDHVTWTKAGEPGTYRRVPEVIDCWFDSGCMPFAQWGYPHADGSRERFEQAFPADFISEAIDQTRGWFYSLLAISTLVFDEETQRELGLGDVREYPHPYKHCVVLGHVCDRTGKKESKSKRNYTPPDIIIDRVTMPMKVVVAGDGGPLNDLAGTVTDEQVGLTRDDHEGLDFQRRGCELTIRKDDASVSCLEPVGAGKADDFAAATDDNDYRHSVILSPAIAGRLGLTTGDTVEIEDATPAPGADAFRWFFYVSPPWNNTRHSLAGVRLAQKETLITLYNVYSFFTIYANIDGFDPAALGATGIEAADLAKATGFRPIAERGELDRWLVSELELTTAAVTAALDDYQVHEAARALSAFVDGLSNWYLRRSRKRFWAPGEVGDDSASTDKLDAYWTTWECLVTLGRLLAPFTPFLADDLFGNLAVAPLGERVAESVHLASWPVADESRIDRALSSRMAAARDVVSLGLAARSAHRLRVRQPLSAVQVCFADPTMAESLGSLGATVAEELNVKAVHFPASLDECVQYEVRPNFKALGPKIGKRMPLVQKALRAADPAALKRELDASGAVAVAVGDGDPITLGPDELEVRLAAKDGFAAEGGRVGVIVLDTEVTPELEREGWGREVVNRIQTMRKDLDLAYVDRISIAIDGPTALTDALAEHRDAIAGETLAVDIAFGPAPDGAEAREVQIGPHTATIAVTRVAG